MNKFSRIFMERKNKFIATDVSVSGKRGKTNNLNVVLTMNKNLESLGFTFDVNTIEYMQNVDRDQLVAFYKWLIPVLKEKTGASRITRPMYPNFPSQVMEADFMELYFNAIIHYLSSGELVPAYAKEERIPLLDVNTKLEVISLGSMDEFVEMMAGIISSNTSISETDKRHLTILADYEPVFEAAIELAENIPHKEVLSFVTALVMNQRHDIDMTVYFKNATDVLRLAVALSDGDVSLAKNTRFVSFPRYQRRFLLNLLDNCGSNIEEDMARHAKKWIRLGERLHPFEMPQFSKAYEAFELIRNSKVSTFNGLLESSITNGQLDLVIELLSTRPGEFARRLDALLRKFETSAGRIIQAFDSVASKVSTPVLLQVLGHFNGRNDKTVRMFMPKGSTAKAMVAANDFEPLAGNVKGKLIETLENALMARFKDLPSLDSVYIDPKLMGYLIPSSQRSASEATHVVTRGSRIYMNSEAKTVRGFIHWYNVQEGAYEDRTDIDLSCIAYDENFTQQLAHVYYGNLRYRHQINHLNIGCHSGDFVNAPREAGGASEFIDMSIEALQDIGARYIVFTINSFTHQPFEKMDCTFGWMEREEPDSGEVFEPATVVNRINLTGEGRMMTPVIFDVEEMCFIWVDMTIENNLRRANNIVNNSYGIALHALALTEMYYSKVNLYDLFYLHAQARGEIVDAPEDADVVFGVHEGDVTAFDLEKIASEYMV